MKASDVPSCAALFIETFTAPPWDEEWTAGDAEQRLEDMVRTPRSEGLLCFDDDQVLVGSQSVEGSDSRRPTISSCRRCAYDPMSNVRAGAPRY